MLTQTFPPESGPSGREHFRPVRFLIRNEKRGPVQNDRGPMFRGGFPDIRIRQDPETGRASLERGHQARTKTACGSKQAQGGRPRAAQHGPRRALGKQALRATRPLAEGPTSLDAGTADETGHGSRCKPQRHGSWALALRPARPRRPQAPGWGTGSPRIRPGHPPTIEGAAGVLAPEFVGKSRPARRTTVVEKVG